MIILLIIATTVALFGIAAFIFKVIEADIPYLYKEYKRNKRNEKADEVRHNEEKRVAALPLLEQYPAISEWRKHHRFILNCYNQTRVDIVTGEIVPFEPNHGYFTVIGMSSDDGGTIVLHHHPSNSETVWTASHVISRFENETLPRERELARAAKAKTSIEWEMTSAEWDAKREIELEDSLIEDSLQELSKNTRSKNRS